MVHNLLDRTDAHDSSRLSRTPDWSFLVAAGFGHHRSSLAVSPRNAGYLLRLKGSPVAPEIPINGTWFAQAFNMSSGVSHLETVMASAHDRPRFGAWCEDGAWNFRLWAPKASHIDLVLNHKPSRALVPRPEGVFVGRWADLHEGDHYWYRVDGRGPFPDPASRCQPCGVHGPSALVDATTYQWRDEGFRAPSLAEAVIYELHIGTFTPEGTFAAAADKLAILAALGVNVIEVMPVAAFAGSRNWGYDGVALFAPAPCYGTPDDFRDFVSAAHAHGLAVILDVVYNHLGPDGAYHTQFADVYLAPGGPWGDALNFRGEAGAAVRAFCLDNVVHWIEEYHLDGLRFDATHAYHDAGERPFLEECTDTLRTRIGRPLLLIAEDDRNDVALVRAPSEGGHGLDAVWADDLHHHLRRLLAGDRDSYFGSYPGTTAAIADTIEHGWYYRGQHSPHHGRPRGTPTTGASLSQFIVCLQNHDQVGNRAFGDRLHHTIDLAAWRAASALLLCLPETPLLFMGQEWAARTPFRYFTDHAGNLGEAITAGRRREFASFARFGGHDVPDPQALDTFEASKLDWRERLREPHASIWRLYRDVIAMRHSELTRTSSPDIVKVQAPDEDSLIVERVLEDGRVCLCVVRLRGWGPIEYLPTFGRCGCCERPWRIQCSTEDPAYASDPQRVAWEVTSEGRQRAEFRRPGALILLG
jgi:maltooligosyltrehalose trehalohydrolase